MSVTILGTTPEILITVDVDINSAGTVFFRDYVDSLTSNGVPTGWESNPTGNLDAVEEDGDATELLVSQNLSGVNYVEATMADGNYAELLLVQAITSNEPLGPSGGAPGPGTVIPTLSGNESPPPSFSPGSPNG